MRLPQAKIKEAILHAEEEVRHTALSYFTDAKSQDATLMPLVIEAVEQYGLPHSFSLLRSAEHLPQTPTTLDWLINKLHRNYNFQNIQEDNHRYALALIVCKADPGILIHQQHEIVSLPAFPDALKSTLDENIKLHLMDWPKLWAAFEELGRQTFDVDCINTEDDRRFRRLIRAMAAPRHQDADRELVLSLLRRKFKHQDVALMQWLEPYLVSLAGHMRLEQSSPLLLKRLNEDNEDVIDEIEAALIRIGGDAVVNAAARQWWSTDTGNRFLLTAALENIHTELALERAMFFLTKEDDFDIQLALGQSILGHFDSKGIEPVRQLVLGPEKDLDNGQRDLRHRLVATATIMQTTFPEYETWHENFVATNYGWNQLRSSDEIYRVANNFCEERDQPASKLENDH